MRFAKVVQVLVPLAVVGGGAYALTRPTAREQVLTGIVTTEDVVVSPQIGGRIDSLFVTEGDSVVQGQVLAVIAPAELAADRAYFVHNAEAVGAHVEAADAELAAAEAQRAEAEATLEKAAQTLDRTRRAAAAGGIAREAVDQAATAVSVGEARVEAARRRVASAQSALVAARQQRDAAAAQAAKADVRLGYAEVRAPLSGIVDVRGARLGEVVAAGQAIVTLVDPDDFWVRADVEESLVDRIRVGDELTVRLPSGRERPGRVFFRGVDAEFATQRDVSRTKRDIKTFEIRLRVDNADRALALGMTAYVVLPTVAP